MSNASRLCDRECGQIRGCERCQAFRGEETIVAVALVLDEEHGLECRSVVSWTRETSYWVEVMICIWGSIDGEVDEVLGVSLWNSGLHLWTDGLSKELSKCWIDGLVS